VEVGKGMGEREEKGLKLQGLKGSDNMTGSELGEEGSNSSIEEVDGCPKVR